MCEVLGVSRSGYYGWKTRPMCQRKQKDKKILEIIIATHKKHDKWGLDAIWAEVKEKILCSRGRVYKLMKQADIHHIAKRSGNKPPTQGTIYL
jgi:putative transposase